MSTPPPRLVPPEQNRDYPLMRPTPPQANVVIQGAEMWKLSAKVEVRKKGAS